MCKTSAALILLTLPSLERPSDDRDDGVARQGTKAPRTARLTAAAACAWNRGEDAGGLVCRGAPAGGMPPPAAYPPPPPRAADMASGSMKRCCGGYAACTEGAAAGPRPFSAMNFCCRLCKTQIEVG